MRLIQDYLMIQYYIDIEYVFIIQKFVFGKEKLLELSIIK